MAWSAALGAELESRIADLEAAVLGAVKREEFAVAKTLSKPLDDRRAELEAFRRTGWGEVVQLKSAALEMRYRSRRVPARRVDRDDGPAPAPSPAPVAKPAPVNSPPPAASPLPTAAARANPATFTDRTCEESRANLLYSSPSEVADASFARIANCAAPGIGAPDHSKTAQRGSAGPGTGAPSGKTQ